VSSAERTRHNTFAGVPLDRAAEYRNDEAWLAAQRGSSHARFLALDSEARVPLRAGRLQWLGPASVQSEAAASLLGLRGDEAWFLLRDNIEHAAFPDAEWLGLRAAAGMLAADQAGLLAYAHGLRNWQNATRYCGYCGAALALVGAGHRAACSACGRLHFPRTDPAIIVLVEHDGACLLGRQTPWPARQYSTLAGFVEPGESLADAVQREVREETSVEVVDCDYHSSQPWPFPASLMLGFTARAAGRAIALSDGELEDARWFGVPQITRGLRDGSLRLSTPLSISYRLIEHWLRTRHGVELGELGRTG
jgi:NAD+ diphosphatase